MAYQRSPLLIGDNKREYLGHEPLIHGTFLMWAPRVWCCVTYFSSLTALLDYLVTNKIKAPSPDGKYQIIFNFVKTFHEPIDYVYFIFDRCVVARLCQQTRFIVPVESWLCRKAPDRTDTVKVVVMRASGATGEDKVGIMIIIGIQCKHLCGTDRYIWHG